MDYTPVTSSSLAEVGYEPRTRTLGVRFRNGGEYHYRHVPQDVYDGLLKAPSKGTYFDQHIKKAGFAFERVTPGRRGPSRA